MAQLQSFGGWAASILDGQEKGNATGRPEEKGWGGGKRKMELVSQFQSLQNQPSINYDRCF